MTTPASFRKVCVIGAGIMGQGIAAHLANARVDVLLLDIVPPKHDPAKHPDKESAAFRNLFADTGLHKAKKAKPALFYSADNARYISTGNLEDHTEELSQCDWIIEVIVENLAIKQGLFAKLEEVTKKSAIVTSNTSGLSIVGMLEGRGADFKKRFCVTHFFNPVRYMELLELVRGPETDPDVFARLCDFGENVLGKGIVIGKDTPNFVANRIGIFGMMETIRVMAEESASIELVDATFGPNMGRAKSAVFRTADVVGLDTFAHVAQNCAENLPDDERLEVFARPAWLQKMLDEGYLGQKAKKGFYKKEGKDLFVLDEKALAANDLVYRPKEKVRTDSLGAARKLDDVDDRIRLLTSADDASGALAWKVTMATAVYAGHRLGEIAESIVEIDNGLRWGFKHERGPFECWDAMGVRSSTERWRKEGGSVPKWVDEMLAAGRESFYAIENGERTVWSVEQKEAVPVGSSTKVATLAKMKRDKTRVVKAGVSASLVDVGDGVLACEFHSKMNALDVEIMEFLNAGMDLCDDGKFDALLIANDGTNFCAGANLLMIFMAAQAKEWGQLDASLRSFQETMQRLKYSRFPTVAAPFQLTLGGGCEVSMWCNRIRAHAESYIGLVEVGVGLIPGAGGHVEMLARTLAGVPDQATFPVEPFLQRAFEQIAMAKVATSAEQGREMMFLAPADGITLNRQHLLEAARQEALGMVRAGFTAPKRRRFRLPGSGAMATFEMVVQSMLEGGFISAHDKKIALKVAQVLTGGDTSSTVKVDEKHILDLEREAFLSLAGEELSQARIGHMLQKNKPLRN